MGVGTGGCQSDCHQRSNANYGLQLPALAASSRGKPGEVLAVVPEDLVTRVLERLVDAADRLGLVFRSDHAERLPFARVTKRIGPDRRGRLMDDHWMV